MTLLNMSLYGAVIILAVIIIRAFTLHKLPKQTFLILWTVALLRLLIPFEIPSGFSLYSLFPEKDTAYVLENSSDPLQAYSNAYNQTTEHRVSVNETGGLSQLPVEAPGGGAVYLPHISPAARTALENNTETSASMEENPDDTNNDFPVIPVLWALGTLLAGTFFFLTYTKCHAEFRTSLPVTEAYAENWLRRHALKRSISIRQSDKISAPLTYGIFHPVILLPKNTDWENTRQLDYVLYHEFTHIRRFDLAAKLLMITTLCLHWFNPFVWIMYFFFNRDLELSCDECVVKHFEEANASYARTLIGMEERKNYSAPLCNHFSKNAIEERITAIMKMQKVTFGVLLASILLIVIVVITLTTSPKETNAGTGGMPLVTTTPTPTPSPTPDPGPTATPPLVTATPSPNPEPTPKPEPEAALMSDGTYAAIVQGCKESSLLLEFVEVVTDADVKRKEELTSFYGWTIENGDLNPDGSLLNGYVIHGTGSGNMEYRLAQDVQIRLINYEGENGESPYIDTSQIHLFLSRIITEYGWSKMPYFFEIENGIITSIHEKFLP